MNNKRFLTIDPGIQGTGIVLWSRSKLQPLFYDCVSPPQKGEYNDRADLILEVLQNIIDMYFLKGCCDVYIEFPEFFTSKKGHTSAARGDLFYLSFLIGRMHELFRSCDMPTEEIEVNTWKGQLSKTAVTARVHKRLGISWLKDHIMDALGIGLWVKGILNMTGNEAPKRPRVKVRKRRRENQS